MKTKSRRRARTAWMAPGQKGSAATPQVRSEDLRQDQHRHVAAQPVAERGRGEQLPAHRLARRGIAVVQLQGVGPAGEVGIPAMRQHHGPAPPSPPRRNCPAPAAAAPGPVHEKLRAVPAPRGGPAPCGSGRNPASAAGRAHAAAAAAAPAPGCRPSPDARHRRLLAKLDPQMSRSSRSGSSACELVPPLRVAARDLPTRLPGAPDAEEIDPVEALRGDAVELGIGDVVQRRRTAERWPRARAA